MNQVMEIVQWFLLHVHFMCLCYNHVCTTCYYVLCTYYYVLRNVCFFVVQSCNSINSRCVISQSSRCNNSKSKEGRETGTMRETDLIFCGTVIPSHNILLSQLSQYITFHWSKGVSIYRGILIGQGNMVVGLFCQYY